MKNKNGFIEIGFLALLLMIIGTLAYASASATKLEVKENVKENVTPSMSSAKKTSFADEALAISKAAENAYVDQMLTGSACFTISDLSNYISISRPIYVGKVVITASDDGMILSKNVYLKNDAFKMVNVNTKNLSNSPASNVYELSDSYPAWSSSYEVCN